MIIKIAPRCLDFNIVDRIEIFNKFYDVPQFLQNFIFKNLSNKKQAEINSDVYKKQDKFYQDYIEEISEEEEDE